MSLSPSPRLNVLQVFLSEWWCSQKYLSDTACCLLSPTVCFFPWAQVTLLGTNTCAMGPSVHRPLAHWHSYNFAVIFMQRALWSTEKLLSPMILTWYMPSECHWSRIAYVLADYVTKLLVKTDTMLYLDWLESTDVSGPGIKPALPSCLCVPTAWALFQKVFMSRMQIPSL